MDTHADIASSPDPSAAASGESITPSPSSDLASVRLDEQGRLAEDMPCRECGYSLRLQTIDGACPECGTPMARSLHPHLLRFANQEWLRRVRLGVRIIVVCGSMWTLLNVMFIVFWRMGGLATMMPASEIIQAYIGVLLILYVGMLPGIWIASSAEPRRILVSQALRRVIRVMAVLEMLPQALISIIVYGVFSTRLVWWSGSGLSFVTEFAIALAGIVLWWSGLTLAVHLARRLPSERLAVQFGFARLLATGGSVLGLLEWIAAWLETAGSSTVVFDWFGTILEYANMAIALWVWVLLMVGLRALKPLLAKPNAA